MTRKEPWSAAVISAVLASGMSLGAVGGLAGAFDIELVSPWIIVAVTLLCALGGAFGGRLRGGWLVPTGVSVVGTALMLWLGDVGLQAKALCDRVTLAYQEAYGWEPTTFFSDPLFVKSLDQLIAWFSALLALWLGFAMVKRANPLVLIGVSAVPILPCLVATHTPPDGAWTFVWVVSMATYLLAVSGHKKRTAPRALRTLTTAVAVIASAAILFTMVPADGEYDFKHEWRDHLLHRIGLHSGSEDNNHTSYSRAPVELLEEAGYPRSTQMVMKILASKETVVYLREQDYNLYDGAAWASDPERYDSMRKGNTADWYLSVQTPVNYARRFVPYYPASRADLEGGNLRNMKRDIDYTWKVAELDENWKAQVEAMATNSSAYTPPSVEYELPDHFLPSLDDDLFVPYESNDFVMVPPPIYAQEDFADITIDPQWNMWMEGRFAEYLALPEATAAWAQTVIEPLVDSGMTYTSKADAIAEFVKGQAQYVEYTYSAPKEGEDFARWFLEDYQKGCCVHFATATAVLLRAAGVPTRYVTGYVREVKRTTWTAVLETHAHAWVEYYEPLMGEWVKLEATPAAAIGFPTEDTDPTMDESGTTTTADNANTTTTTRPSVTAPTEPQLQLPIKEILLVVAVIAGITGIIVGQRALRLAARRRRKNRADPNTCARLMWRETQWFARACREEPPERLYELAQKAAFSCSTLTAEELTCFDEYAKEAIARLKQQPMIKRMWFRLVSVLY